MQIEKSINIMQDFMRAPDKAIPPAVLSECAGLCFLTVVRAGFVFTGKVGTGLVVAKKVILPRAALHSCVQKTPCAWWQPDGSGWTGPSAVVSTGVGWGAQIGGEITDYIVVIRTPGPAVHGGRICMMIVLHDGRIARSQTTYPTSAVSHVGRIA